MHLYDLNPVRILRPAEMVITAVVEQQAKVSGVLSTVGAVATTAGAEVGLFEIGYDHSTAGAVLLACTALSGFLSATSASRARGFRERALELRGLPPHGQGTTQFPDVTGGEPHQRENVEICRQTTVYRSPAYQPEQPTTLEVLETVDITE
jgi:hypothetical protein